MRNPGIFSQSMLSHVSPTAHGNMLQMENLPWALRQAPPLPRRVRRGTSAGSLDGARRRTGSLRRWVNATPYARDMARRSRLREPLDSAICSAFCVTETTGKTPIWGETKGVPAGLSRAQCEGSSRGSALW